MLLDGARHLFCLRCPAFTAEERLDEEIQNVAHRHTAGEAMQYSKRLNRVMRQLVEKNPQDAGNARAVDHLAGKAEGIDLRAFEVLVPIGLVIYQSALHVLFPEWASAVNAQTVEREGIQPEP